MRPALAASLALLALTGPAAAEVASAHIVEHYSVTALDSQGLRDEMDAKGPNDYWAHTTWYIEWSARCEVSLRTRIVMPRHAAPDSLPPALRAEWERFEAALLAHEIEHRDFGIAAAEEIESSHCRNAGGVIDRWSARDVELDSRTDHGRNTGAYLD
ncbi:DUF922 domain-containing protein [Pseudooceanicola sp. 216_PA32_1]|uniref:DUF922 domain-containing protein n=1 Tax=Pseudooceanicola pacificus TaxID=2676438 RepID=A0A844W8V0_9RHOB|nr:DUF922 domain-containing protein [Pseudooceanicola pacificus]MWB76908.1 DUF922 domain-containing protein [Pseudooceanicola pacificus]